MTEEEARRIARDYLDASRDRIPLSEPHGWSEPIGVYGDVLPAAWLLVYRGDLSAEDPNSDFHALVVPRNGSPPHILLGALGKVFRNHKWLGAPRSNERWLGSGPGRYQLFAEGIAMWYATPPDLAIPRYVSHGDITGRSCEGYVAFVDLRGFTSWTLGRDVKEIQETIAGLEDVFHLVFTGPEFPLLFVKGIGDGLMIVSEVQPLASSGNCNALSFLTASATFVWAAASRLPRPLGIGAALSFGPLVQVFLLGQYDYLGETLNHASKLQQLAWNDVVVSTEFTRRLRLERPSAVNLLDGGKRLGEQGVRLDPERLIRSHRRGGDEA